METVQKPLWVKQLNIAILKNQQLEFTQYYQLSVPSADGKTSLCDTLQHFSLVSENLSLPFMLSSSNTRHDIGQGIQALEEHSLIEVCWMFPLTKDKFRLRCKASIDSDYRTQIWNSNSDD